MFKKNKKEIFKVIHFEGINEFMQNAPCEIELKEDIFEIRNNMTKSIATLPKNRIQKLEYLLEKILCKNIIIATLKIIKYRNIILLLHIQTRTMKINI